jgi:hypothetical protein
VGKGYKARAALGLEQEDKSCKDCYLRHSWSPSLAASVNHAIAQTNPNPPTAPVNPFVGSWVVEETGPTAIYDNTGKQDEFMNKALINKSEYRRRWKIDLQNGRWKIEEDGKPLALRDVQSNSQEISFTVVDEYHATSFKYYLNMSVPKPGARRKDAVVNATPPT